MKIINKRMILSILTIGLILSGCNRQSENIDKSSLMKLDIEESPEENLEINLHVDYSEWEKGEIHTLKIKPYKGDDKQWVTDIANTYFASNSMDKPVVDQENEKSMYISGEDHLFMVSPEIVWFYKHQVFADSASFFYREPGIEEFFLKDIDQYYQKQDLDFMTYDSARALSDKFMFDVGYEYKKEGVRGYALKADQLNKYRKDHQEEFDGLTSLTEDKSGVIEEWTSENEFYVFYYPCSINGLTIMPSQTFAFTWAYTAINRDGIESGQAGPVFQITDSEERTMITAQEALDKIQAMYQSTIITQKIQIYDLQLQYSITKYDKESGSYQCSPIWKFFVRMDSGDGEMVHSTVTYNAETGERMG